MLTPDDYYTILGIPYDASAIEIRRAYHQLARRLHPDVNSDPLSNEHFLLIQKAYEVLSVAEQRAAYDKLLEIKETPPSYIVSQVHYSRESLATLKESQLLYAMLEISPSPQATPAASPPLNVCLVLDRSTSMQGTRMDMVKAAAIELIRKLRPEDIISIVAFSDRAEVIIPSGPVHTPAELETRIQMIQTGGATEIFYGLEAGLREVRFHLRKHQLAHLILLTDGRTYGDEPACLELANEAAELGVGISGFGIGEDWNDVFLDSLASRTGGSAIYISEPGQIKNQLLSKFNGFGEVYVKDLRLLLDLRPGVTLKAAYRQSPEPGPLASHLPLQLGHLARTQSLRLLLELEVNGGLEIAADYLLGAGILQYEPTHQATGMAAERIHINRPVSARLSPTRLLNENLVTAARQLNLLRLQEKAAEEVEQGEIDRAASRLEHMATHLYEEGAANLAHTAMIEADHLRRQQTFSNDGKLRIKYGTRALLLPPPKPGAHLRRGMPG